MNKFAPFALLATVATLAVIPATVFAAESSQQVGAVAERTAAASAVTATTGNMLYGPDGRRIAAVYRAAANGDAELILDGRLLTVPASSLSINTGKLTTSLTKREIKHR